MSTATVNGNIYSDDGTSDRDMQDDGHRDWLIPMLGDAVVEVRRAEAAATSADGSRGAAAGAEANAAASAASAVAAKVAAEAAASSMATIAYQNLAVVARKVAGSASIAAVDMYDASKDSDGGAWLALCPQMAWYGETLGTATRGGTRPFPKLALIVATTATVTIHDATDPLLPMWMVFSLGGAATGTANALGLATDVIGSVAAREGKIVVGRTNAGVVVIDFVTGGCRGYTAAAATRYNGSIAARNAGKGWETVSTTGIVSAAVNAVAITVPPAAAFDLVTGLPKATIAAATDGGISFINPDGTVANLTDVGGYKKVAFITPGWVAALLGDLNLVDYGPIPGSTTTRAGWSLRSCYSRSPTYSWDIATAGQYFGAATAIVGDGGTLRGIGSAGGLALTIPDLIRPNAGMTALVTTSYATGWLPGDIRLALAEKDAASLVGGTVADRSGKANDLTVNGTITRTAVAAGTDLTAYGGFGAANYLSRAADADFDFGTGDFAILLWYSAGAEAANVILDRAVTEAVRIVLSTAGGVVRFTATGAGGTAALVGTDIRSTGYRMIVAVRRGARVELWLDGRMVVATAAQIGSVNAPAPLIIGRSYAGAFPLSAAARIALPRITAYAPGPERIARIYADEAPLFQANAKCLLGGTANQVDALAHDPDTDRLLAAGPDGTSIFKGLTRVGYIDGAVDANLTSDGHNAVAAARGGYLIASAAEAVASLPALNLREELI